MSIYALALILVASFTHAYWNYLSKRANGKIPFIWLIYLISGIIYLPFVIWQTAKTGAVAITWLMLGIALVSAVLRLSYFIVLQAGYRKGDLSVVYPLARGSGPVFSTLGAIFFMQERPTIYSLTGLLLIITGVLIITKLRFAANMSAKLKTGLFYGIITGLFIGSYTVWDKLALSKYLLPPLIIIYTSNVFGAIVLAPAALYKVAEVKRELKQHIWHIAAIAVLSPFSYILVLKAMQTTPVLYVAPAREVSILLGVFMGSRLMNEEDTKRRLVASIFILSGIVFLAIG